VRNAQAAIARTSPGKKERELLTQLRDTEVGRSLFSPLDNYNNFAAEFNCQVYPDRPLWWQELDFDDQTTLRIYGLTSTILSGLGIPNDIPDRKGDLYLSRFQTVLNPEEGVVNLVMCHHPPDWFSDADEIEDHINGRSLIHMFGHKHRQRITREENYVRFSAGAVNPDPVELGWEPGYNLVVLSIKDAEGQRFMDLEAHLRRWQIGPPDGFVAKTDPTGEQVFAKRLRVYGTRSPAHKAIYVPNAKIGLVAGLAESAAVEQAAIEPSLAVAGKLEAVMSETGTKNLVLRFWGLRASERRDIALRLNLIGPDEMRLPEPERYGRALLRAGERGLLEKVEEEVNRMETRHG
jgi:hypothetical protein